MCRCIKSIFLTLKEKYLECTLKRKVQLLFFALWIYFLLTLFFSAVVIKNFSIPAFLASTLCFSIATILAYFSLQSIINYSEEDVYYTVADFKKDEKTSVNALENSDENEDAKNYYIFDISTFVCMHNYAKQHNCHIKEFVGGHIPLSNAMNNLVEVIKERVCFVTHLTYQKLQHYEEIGEVEKGTIAFINENFSVFENNEPVPEHQMLLCSKISKTTYEEDDYKLIWDAVGLMDDYDVEVTIVTLHQEIALLAQENCLEIVNPMEIS